MNERWKRDDIDGVTKKLHRFAMPDQLLVVPTPGNLTQEVDVAFGRRQCEVQARRDRSQIPTERQAFGGAAEIGIDPLENVDQSWEVFWLPRVDEINVIGGCGRAVCDRCNCSQCLGLVGK